MPRLNSLGDALMGLMPFTWAKRCVYSLLKWHTQRIDACVQCSVFQAGQVSQLSKGQHLAFIQMAFNIALVLVLFLASRPSAVRLAIRPIVVNTLKCHFRRRARTHVTQELREVAQPFAADVYTASTVVLKALFSRARASTLHVLPNLVLGRFLTDTGHAMLQIGIVFPTRARETHARSSSDQTPSPVGLNLAARALACCANLTRVNSPQWLQNSPLGKHVSRLYLWQLSAHMEVDNTAFPCGEMGLECLV